MSRKARLVMISLLCVALSSSAFAYIEPADPGEPDYGPEPTGDAVYADQSVTADSTSSGSVNLWPGGGACSAVFFASRITFDVDVIPNLSRGARCRGEGPWSRPGSGRARGAWRGCC